MPAPGITFGYHVNGPVVLQAQMAQGASFVLVGVCENGIDLEFKTYKKEVKSDGAGGSDGAPANFVFLNQTLTARCTLVPFAGTYVNGLRSLSQGTTAGTDGVMPQSGTLMGFSTGSLPGVRFVSGDIDGGWWLRNCYVGMPGDAKSGVTETKPRFEFMAVNYYDPTTTATILGSTLYSRI